MADLSNPDICPVRDAFQLVLRKIRLKHPLSLPEAVFVNESGATKYLTASKIVEVIGKAACMVYPAERYLDNVLFVKNR